MSKDQLESIQQQVKDQLLKAQAKDKLQGKVPRTKIAAKLTSKALPPTTIKPNIDPKPEPTPVWQTRLQITAELIPTAQGPRIELQGIQGTYSFFYFVHTSRIFKNSLFFSNQWLKIELKISFSSFAA